jgi:hypothetical protein
MIGRLSLVSASLLAVLAFLLLFASGGKVEATTFKIQYDSSLSCNGDDVTYSTLDDSCVKDGTYGANGANLTADMLSSFEIATATPRYSNFDQLYTMGIPSAWYVATDKEIPNGTLVGKMTAVTTLGLTGNGCRDGTGAATITVPMLMYDCTTDNFEGVNDGCPKQGTAETLPQCNDHLDNDGDGYVNDGCPAVGIGECDINQDGDCKDAGETAHANCANASDDDGDGDPMVAWDASVDGRNLTYGYQNGLPAACNKYPTHVNTIMEGLKPRARYLGFYTVVGGGSMAPTQLEFLIFSTEELTAMGVLPQTDMGDDLGYINYVILDNPDIPAAPGGALEEFCTPLSTLTNLYGLTSGEGGLEKNILAAGDVPTHVGSFWKVGRWSGSPPTLTAETCGNHIDDDGDTKVDENCGFVRVRNPGLNTGIYGTNSHLVAAYSETYRDADGDTIPNNEDECPLQKDTYVGGVWQDSDLDHINDVCDPDPTNATTVCPGVAHGILGDCDGDGWHNQADNCPLVAQTNQNDTDNDGIGDACDNNNWDAVSDGPNNARDRILGLSYTAPGEDTLVNKCNDNKDDDADGAWDDNCTLDSEFPNGRLVNAMVVGSICIGAADSDGDGWCDGTENKTGPGGALSLASTTPEYNPATTVPETDVDVNPVNGVKDCQDGLDNDGDGYIDGAYAPSGCQGLGCDAGCSTPEYFGIDFTVRAGDPAGAHAPAGVENPPGAAPESCTNYDYYDVTQSHPGDAHQNGAPAPLAGMVDDDGDTVANQLGTVNTNPDANCACETPDKVNDNCVAVGTLGAESACDDALDSDTADTTGAGVRDESDIIGACSNKLDDDYDNTVNDGCPAVGDGYVNDGCPAYGFAECDLTDDAGTGGPDGDCDDAGDDLTRCADAVDSDADHIVNDGCPQQGGVSETGDALTGQCSNATDDDQGTDPETAGECSGNADDDHDGFANDGCPPVGDGYVNDGCPQVGNFGETAGAQCANNADDDGDPDCDGVPNASDNCPSAANPTQLNTDYMGGIDLQGDACDTDDDNDKSLDVDEWAMGTDPKNVCDPTNFDLKPGGGIGLADVLIFSNKIFGMSCNQPADYTICEPVYQKANP